MDKILDDIIVRSVKEDGAIELYDLSKDLPPSLAHKTLMNMLFPFVQASRYP